MKPKYVWYKTELGVRKVWRQESNYLDYFGRVLLIDLQDTSSGTSAFPKDIREVDNKTLKAINWWLYDL